MKLIECVPNFSEGRDPDKIQRIANAIQKTGAALLHIDAGYDANRTVMTFVGTPDVVLEASFQSIQTASDVIDMRFQTGAHPRIGAVDVFPMVPFQNCSMDECTALSRKLGRLVGELLNIPVYLYNQSASKPSRQNLAVIRRGEYEAFADKMKQSQWQPDFGPNQFNAKTGATAIGARNFLIAYNINLAAKKVDIAQKIAGQLRESGVVRRKDNRILRDARGKALRRPGRFKSCKAIGWAMPALGCTQVSINLTNMNDSLPHQVFETCCDLAEQAGTRVTGSELIGLIPYRALAEAAAYYSGGTSDSNAINLAVQKMGLSQFGPFNPEKRILEWAYAAFNKQA